MDGAGSSESSCATCLDDWACFRWDTGVTAGGCLSSSWLQVDSCG